MTIAFFIFLMGLLLATGFRVWQYLTNIDLTTGFYIKSGISSWGIWVLLGLMLGLLLFFVLRDKNTMDHPFHNKTKMLGLAFFIYGAIAGFYCYQNAMSTLALPSPTIFNFVFIGFNTIVVLSFLISGILLLFSRRQSPVLHILMLLPVLWSMFRLWEVYMYDKPTLTISENLMEIISYFFICLFFMSLAYCIAGFNEIRHSLQVLIFGFAGGTLLISNTVAKLVVLSNQGANFGTIDTDRAILNLSLALILVVAPVYICFGKDPLLDYDVLYESDTEIDDPLKPIPSKIPMGPLAGHEFITPWGSEESAAANLEKPQDGEASVLENPFHNNPNYLQDDSEGETSPVYTNFLDMDED